MGTAEDDRDEWLLVVVDGERMRCFGPVRGAQKAADLATAMALTEGGVIHSCPLQRIEEEPEW